MTPEKVFPVFFVSWMVLGVGLFIFYQTGRLETKRRAHPWIVIGVGVLFLAFASAMQPTWSMLLFAAPAVAVITALNTKLIKFCPKCGSTLYGRFIPIRFCYKCGASLTPE